MLETFLSKKRSSEVFEKLTPDFPPKNMSVNRLKILIRENFKRNRQKRKKKGDTFRVEVSTTRQRSTVSGF